MPEEVLGSLSNQLGGPPPGAVAQLDTHHLQHLDDALRAARHRQADELRAAGDQALNHIPRLLRGPIRKIVGQ